MKNLSKKVSPKTRHHIEKVKHHWLTISFFLGFLIDNVTLVRIDQTYDLVVLFLYVVFSMGGLLLAYAAAAEKLHGRLQPYARKYGGVVMQFFFGGLLSGMLIFYGRSGAWLESWPFLLIILAVIYGNETVKNRTQRLIYNVAMLFIGLFAYVVLIIPVVTGKMGDWVFIGSGLLALLVMVVFLKVLRLIVPNFMKLHLRSVIFTVGSIYLAMNFFYFANIIPPIPLSLKELGIYNTVVHLDSGDYQLTYEKPKWYQFWIHSDKTIHVQTGTPIYCFASVFAPTKLATKIYHRWEQYNNATGKWLDHGRFSYSIEGGRDTGFRGYTLIRSYTPGTWRCSVETERGQVLGREKFIIEKGTPTELVTREE
jgi:MFS family permease